MREGCPVGCAAPVLGTCHAGTCQQGISCSTGCSAPCQPRLAAHCSGCARTRVPAGRLVWFSRCSYAGSVSSTVFFCPIVAVVGSAE